MKKYDGISPETLARHADEGWALANLRTAQLRQAADCLKMAKRLLLFHGKPGFTSTEPYRGFQKSLEWIEQMFPEETPKLSIEPGIMIEDPELEKRRDHDL